MDSVINGVSIKLSLWMFEFYFRFICIIQKCYVRLEFTLWPIYLSFNLHILSTVRVHETFKLILDSAHCVRRTNISFSTSFTRNVRVSSRVLQSREPSLETIDNLKWLHTVISFQHSASIYHNQLEIHLGSQFTSVYWPWITCCIDALAKCKHKIKVYTTFLFFFSEFLGGYTLT